MNAVLEKFAHNPIIDEIVYCPPRQKRLVRIEREIPTDGNCMVSLVFDDSTTEVVSIDRGCFESHWNEAVAVFSALLNLDGNLAPLSVAEIESLESARQDFQAAQRKHVLRNALRLKQQAIRCAKELFDIGAYDQFLQQFGPDVTDLPPELEKRIAIAANKIETKV